MISKIQKIMIVLYRFVKGKNCLWDSDKSMTRCLNRVPNQSFRRSGAPTGKLVGKCHFLPSIVNNRSEKKRTESRLIVLPSCPFFPPSSPLYHAIAYFLLFTLFLAHFLHLPPGHARPSAVKYLDHSPNFPDGFSRTSTAGRSGCSWGGRLWWIRSQCSGRIFPESRPQSGRSVCPSPPGHKNSRTTVIFQITK